MKHKLYKCPCCGYYTLDSYDEYDICPVCFWEDDPYQRENPEEDGGANQVSLIEGRENYKKFGACEKEMMQYVRRPRGREK